MRFDWPDAYAAMHAKGEPLFPPAGLYYVLESVRKAAREARVEGRDEALKPEELVADFRKRARTDFGPLLPEVLNDWGLASPAELGEAVLLLGRHGLLTLAPSDTLEAFARDARPLAARAAEEAENPAEKAA